MGRCFSFAILLSALCMSTALADIPLESHLKYIQPLAAFEGLERYPDHAFFLRYYTFWGHPEDGPSRAVIELRDSKPFTIGLSRRTTEFELLALERKEFEKLAQGQKSLMWLDDKTPGVISANLWAPSVVISKMALRAPVTTYRVSLRDEKLEVERSATSEIGPLTWSCGLSVSLTAALVCVGLWMKRRGGRKPQSRDAAATIRA